MDLVDQLLEVERRFWEVTPEDGVDVYRANMAEEAVMVLAPPMAIIGKAETVPLFENLDSPPWASYAISQPKAISLGSDGGLLVYTVLGTRPDTTTYAARVGSGYVRRDGRWLLVFHQQTPI